MSEKIHHARCCGCNLQIDVNGEILRGDADGDFDNMRQVRGAAKNHRWFCTNYTGEFRVTAEWYVDVIA
jgi:hypothetical protein